MIRNGSFENFDVAAACDNDAAADVSSTASSYTNYDDDSSESSFEDDGDAGVLMASASAADQNSGLFLSLEMVQMLRLSTSDGNLAGQAMQQVANKMAPPAGAPRRNSGGTFAPKMVFALQTKSPMESHAHHKDSEANVPKPKDTYKYILMGRGIEPKYYKSADITDLLVKGSVSEYSLELMTAVRSSDLATIRKHHEEGHSLQCCNKFGESTIHAMARRGDPEIIRYFVETAKCSIRVCCDGGRTPLHDAAWTGLPNFAAIRILLEDCPDFLLVQDKRGFTPLDFIPKDAHEIWNEFLNENKDLVIPKGLFELLD